MSTSSIDVALSVVVGSNGAHDSVERFLEAVAPQIAADVEVIVCEAVASADGVRLRYPAVRFLEREEALVPELWRDGIDEARGDVVLLTISPMLPAPDWVATALRLSPRPTPWAVPSIRRRACAFETGRSTSAGTHVTCCRLRRTTASTFPATMPRTGWRLSSPSASRIATDSGSRLFIESSMRRAAASVTIRGSSSDRVDPQGSPRSLDNASTMADSTGISEGRTSGRHATLREYWSRRSSRS